MPELAEVEYYRRQWNPGLGARVRGVKLHAGARVFRGTDALQLCQALPGSVMSGSAASGKRMLFRFSNQCWLGVHLGMTGKLGVGGPGHSPAKHDHLVIECPSLSLIFNDPRQFGRIQFHLGANEPPWWHADGPDLSSRAFNVNWVQAFLKRHPGLPLKAALLQQSGFPGVGNWMADEILWRAGLSPLRSARNLNEKEVRELWLKIRFVCRQALKTVARDFSDPPRTWLYHQRWGRGGVCPRHKGPLLRDTVGGRTTAWCGECQR